jgi:hypothetical protein
MRMTCGPWRLLACQMTSSTRTTACEYACPRPVSLTSTRLSGRCKAVAAHWDKECCTCWCVLPLSSPDAVCVALESVCGHGVAVLMVPCSCRYIIQLTGSVHSCVLAMLYELTGCSCPAPVIHLKVQHPCTTCELMSHTCPAPTTPPPAGTSSRSSVTLGPWLRRLTGGCLSTLRQAGGSWWVGNQCFGIHHR